MSQYVQTAKLQHTASTGYSPYFRTAGIRSIVYEGTNGQNAAFTATTSPCCIFRVFRTEITRRVFRTASTCETHYEPTRMCAVLSGIALLTRKNTCSTGSREYYRRAAVQSKEHQRTARVLAVSSGKVRPVRVPSTWYWIKLIVQVYLVVPRTYKHLVPGIFHTWYVHKISQQDTHHVGTPVILLLVVS